MSKHSLPSIEQFAAFIDGNLSQNQMQQLSQLAEHDDELHLLLDASSEVDDTLAGFSYTELQLPPEIAGSDFKLPTIPEEDISSLVASMSEPMDDILAAAAACADDDIPAFPNIMSENYSISDRGSHDEPSHPIPEDDGFDGSDDFPSLTTDDL